VSLADDVEPRSLEQARYSLTEQGVIVRQDNALACFAHYVSPPSGESIVDYTTGQFPLVRETGNGGIGQRARVTGADAAALPGAPPSLARCS
jgi:hypothetical protein